MANKFRGDITTGVTDVTIYVKLVSSVDGSDVTGIAGASVTAYYWKQAASSVVQITVTDGSSLGAAHADGKWWEVDSTNMPGIYRLDLVDAAVSSSGSADWVLIDVTATGCKHYQVAYNLDPLAVNSSGQVTLGSTASGAITASSFAASAIDATAIASNAITAAKIATDAITATQVQDGFLTAAKLGADCITAAKIADGALVAANFDTDALSSTAASAAFCQKIADQILGRTLGSEAYAALGAVPTVKEALFMLLSFYFHSTSGTTLTFKKLDMSTAAMTGTFAPDATNPTSLFRAS